MELINHFEAWNSNVPTRRACQECNRKKTKCDMQRPICGLCQRVGTGCTFPTRRKRPELRNKAAKNIGQGSSQKIKRLVDLIEANLQNGGNLEGLLHSSLNPNRESVSPNPRQSSKVAISSDSRSTISPNFSNERLSGIELSPNDRGLQATSPIDSLYQPTSPVSERLPNAALNAFSTPHDLPPEVALELVDIYFDKIQAWLPLLHRPRFYQHHDGRRTGRSLEHENLTLEEEMIFSGIFALAARYSTSEFFAATPELERGNRFADKAIVLYERARSEIGPPNILYLQGCILLAFYYYASGPCPKGWILTGVCVRLAYELDLSNLDEDEAGDLTSEEWTRREELRRAWWLVWELDTFGSTVSARPYTIDRSRMMVMLPVSDEAWFAENPVPSARLETEPGKVWTSLQGSPNQDERAWFLVGNFLMSIAHDFFERRNGISADEKFALENALNCFNLALPSSFHLETGCLSFNLRSYTRSNWIISTHLMMLSTRILISNIAVRGASPTALSTSPSRTAQLNARAIEVSRIITRWSPEYITVSHPFIACTMFPVHIPGDAEVVPSSTISGAKEMAQLVLSHYARIWKLGTILLKLSKILEYPQLTPKDLDLARRFAVFFPRTLKTEQTSQPISEMVERRRRPAGLFAVNDWVQDESTNFTDSITRQTNGFPIETPQQGEDQFTGVSHNLNFGLHGGTDTGMPSELVPNHFNTFPSFGTSDQLQSGVDWGVRRNSWDATVLDFFGQACHPDFQEFWA